MISFRRRTRTRPSVMTMHRLSLLVSLLLATPASITASPDRARRRTSHTHHHTHNNLAHREYQESISTRITDWTFKPRIKECLSELPDDPTACDSMADWDISRVTDCSLLFWEALDAEKHDYKLSPGAEAFNVDLSHWNTSSCTTMRSMFHSAIAFDSSIGEWNVEKVTDMAHM